MRTFGWSYEFVRFGITAAQGWAWHNWAMANEVTMMGPVYKMVTDGYVKQERDRILGRKKK